MLNERFSKFVKRGEAEVTVYEDGDIEKGKVEIWDGESTEVPEIKEFNWNIYNGAQLKFLADFVNNGNKLTEEQKVQIAEEGYQESDIVLNENTTVNLMNNIDLGARQENGELTSGVQWKPIGKTLDNCLKANFEGNNYTIKGVYVNEETDYSGIFGVSATVKNLTVKDGYIEGSGYTGGIVGGCYDSIENCYNTGKVIGKTSIGGIVGESANTFTITKCYSKGEVEGESQIGAAIGIQEGGTDNLSSLYYLNTIGVKGINEKDVADKVMGVEDDINSYEEFIGWIENK